jgi:hypothetical protein
MKESRKILSSFFEDCSSKIELEGILEFGSSVYSEDAQDMDFIFISKNEIVPIVDRLFVLDLMKRYEENFSDLVFDFGGINNRRKKAKFSVTIVFVSQSWLKIKHNPHDLFFIKLLKLNKNIKIIYGKNPFKLIKINFNSEHLFEMLERDFFVLFRSCLDSEEEKLSRARYEFKSFLRGMLIHLGDFRKDELLKKFEEEFGERIILPVNSKLILENKMLSGDFEDILKFCNNCLIYLKDLK